MVSKAVAEPTEFVYEKVDGVNHGFIISSRFERADCCDAKSYILVEFGASGVLYFCFHHYNKHKSKLFEVATYIRDESLSLTPNKLVGSEK